MGDGEECRIWMCVWCELSVCDVMVMSECCGDSEWGSVEKGMRRW